MDTAKGTGLLSGRDAARPGTPVATVNIYPGFNALYYSYFLAGLSEVFGWEALHFTTAGFPDFGHDCLAVKIVTGGSERRIYFEANDSPELEPRGLAWCDILAKVNCCTDSMSPEIQNKVVPVGPAFPVRLWDTSQAFLVALRNLAKSNVRLRSYALSYYDPRYTVKDVSLLICVKRHLINYAKLFSHRRLPLAEYRPGKSHGNYIFFSSGLWPEVHRVPEWAKANRTANQNRLAFLLACRSVPGVVVEGGFWARKRVKVSGYEKFTSRVEYRHEEYIEQTKSSAVVFNTPAYKGCHSWKLGEFLALGKAIISVPMLREMPAPLVHGTHIHFVDGSTGETRDAVARICSDDDYRHHLEVNARAYFETYLQPAQMVRRLLEARVPFTRGRGDG
ncbi:hypothetical protein BH24GEM2_BH24GEM2_03000 [soil metagenome]